MLLPNADTLFFQAGYAQALGLVPSGIWEGPDLRLRYWIEEKTAYTWHQASFGGFEVVELPIFVEAFPELREQMRTYFRQQGVERLIHQEAPDIYPAQQSAFWGTWPGAQVLWSDLNFHLDVSPRSFWQQVHPSYHHKLNRLERQGARVRVPEESQLSDWFAVIAQNRTERGFFLPISLPQVQALRQACPQHYDLLGLYHEGVCLASALGVRVSAKVYYAFVTASHPRFRSLSPVLPLLQHMYQRAQDLGCWAFDLGTASWQGRVNTGNADFKRRMGGQPGVKIRWEIPLLG